MSEVNTTRSTPSSKRQWFIGLLLLALVIVLIWWFWPAKTAPQGNTRWGFDNVPVRIAHVESRDFPIVLKALGTVIAYNTANVRSRVDGQLLKVLFKDGQPVKAGDVLAQIDPRPFEIALQQAQGTLAENQAQLRNAEKDLALYRGLFAEDSIARQTLDTQEALVNQYRGALQNNQGAVAEAKLNLDFTKVRAPIDGRLGIRQVDQGNLVNSGDTNPIVVITQTLPISVTFTLPEAELPAVLAQVRNERTLVVQAWDRGENNQLAEGVLESLDNQIDTTTGTVKLKARFENAEEMLFPNQFVNTRLQVSVRENALLVPVAALQFGANGTFVYVIDAEDKVEVRKVKVGPGDGEFTVIEEGVAAAERVVVEGTDRLRAGNKVEVIGEGTREPSATEENAPRVRSAS
ncbi:multidrug transporter subunit MdtA [Pseudomonas daroniae]|uniref:Multidrug transporter subunit MdtA n=1 Tax=Phytopseudomonas daroniae TaxID=2487519 RepID=A0A4Q9QFV3_9GAMM|nr:MULTISPECIES: MdtA/MuxA family multidrug efflux RND transporter periplasmic adaptor subunit [Pseudomonas]TBU72322.1 multidrug transporter subunit MdtA [Pseudomonas daroniae]TBU74135.1 multidrug transporter subunit MdtA [Pseudomonas daroniae]TBU76627.1 multidrug transporter subunit MdtA [Pseudomonas sp. FRB 228]TBU87300.1 multidrug transporter subunit MdtA [Pseudomonas daroniae]